MIRVIHFVEDFRESAGGIRGFVSSLLKEVSDPQIAHAVYSPRGVMQARRNDIPARIGAAWKRSLHLDLEEPGIEPVFHIHGLWSINSWNLVRCAQKKKIPYIVSTHGMLLPWARRHHGGRKWLAWRLYQKSILSNAARIHVTSNAEANAVGSAIGNNTTVTIPIGIATASADAHSTRTPFRSGNRPLLFLGRCHPIKNLPTLIRACARALPLSEKLLIAGPVAASYKAQLITIAGQVGLEDRIEWLGQQGPVEKLTTIRRGYGMALPSYSENFGLVVLEALNEGVPVIASTGTPWRILAEAQCGWWTEPKIEDLSRSIAALYSLEADCYNSIAARCQALTAEHFDWQKIIKKYESIYRTTCREKYSPVGTHEQSASARNI